MLPGPGPASKGENKTFAACMPKLFAGRMMVRKDGGESMPVVLLRLLREEAGQAVAEYALLLALLLLASVFAATGLGRSIGERLTNFRGNL